MVVVTPPGDEDPLLDQVRAYLEREKSKEPRRSYLGASSLGHSCERAVWYGFHKPEIASPMKANGILAVNDGHRSEALMTELLRAMPGIELQTDNGQGHQIGFSDFGGKFAGHVDGIIKGIPLAPVTKHCWEHKSAGQKRFDAFLKAKKEHGSKGALKAWDFKYYVQGILYMDYLGLTRHYLTVSLGGLRDFASCRTEADPDMARALREKIKMMLDLDIEPGRISDDPENYLCRFCDFREPCHGAIG